MLGHASIAELPVSGSRGVQAPSLSASALDILSAASSEIAVKSTAVSQSETSAASAAQSRGIVHLASMAEQPTPSVVLSSSPKDPDVTLTGPLSASMLPGAIGSAIATAGKISGKWYFECTSGPFYAPHIIGIGNQMLNINQAPGYDANSKAFGNVLNLGDVLGVALDLNMGGTDKFNFYVNGVFIQQLSQVDLYDSYTWFPMIGSAGGGACQFELNFGSAAFAYPPPPGFLPYDLVGAGDYPDAVVVPGGPSVNEPVSSAATIYAIAAINSHAPSSAIAADSQSAAGNMLVSQFDAAAIFDLPVSNLAASAAENSPATADDQLASWLTLDVSNNGVASAADGSAALAVQDMSASEFAAADSSATRAAGYSVSSSESTVTSEFNSAQIDVSASVAVSITPSDWQVSFMVAVVSGNDAAITFDSSTSYTSQDGATSENSSNSDALSVAAIYQASVTEAAILLDAAYRISELYALLIEQAICTDVTRSTIAGVSSYVEFSQALSTQASSMAVQALISGAVTSLDTQDSAKHALSSISEAVVIGESALGLVGVLADAYDAAAASEQFAVSALFQSACGEVISLAEQQNITMAFLAFVSDGAAPVSIESAQTAINSHEAAATTSAESLLANINATASVFEYAAAHDQGAGAAFALASSFNQATAEDSTACLMLFNSAAVESCLAADYSIQMVSLDAIAAAISSAASAEVAGITLVFVVGERASIEDWSVGTYAKGASQGDSSQISDYVVALSVLRRRKTIIVIADQLSPIFVLRKDSAITILRKP